MSWFRHSAMIVDFEECYGEVFQIWVLGAVLVVVLGKWRVGLVVDGKI